MTTLASRPAATHSAVAASVDAIDARTGFLVESAGGRLGVVVGVRSIKAGRRRVEALIVSAGESSNRVLIIPVSEIREVLPARHRVLLCASPQVIGTEPAAPAADVVEPACGS